MSGYGSAARQSPFVGLRSFGPDDAGFFFGRARESATLAGALLGNALTVLFGPPGGGKTSLIRVTVAAYAAVLLLRRDTDYYPRLTSILVYPSGYFVSGVQTPSCSVRARESPCNV